jgi:hypothetical protein
VNLASLEQTFLTGLTGFKESSYAGISSSFKAAMSVKPLRSVFMNTLVKGLRKKTGKLTEVIG